MNFQSRCPSHKQLNHNKLFILVRSLKERDSKNWIKDQKDEVNHIKNTLTLSQMLQVVSSASDNLLGFELANSEGICFKVITANFAAFRLRFTFLQTVKTNILLLFQWDKPGSWNLIKGYKFNEICGSSMTDLKTITLCRSKKSCFPGDTAKKRNQPGALIGASGQFVLARPFYERSLKDFGISVQHLDVPVTQIALLIWSPAPLLTCFGQKA